MTETAISVEHVHTGDRVDMVGVDDEEPRFIGPVLYRWIRYTCPRCREAVVVLVRQKEDTPPAPEVGTSGVSGVGEG